MRDTGHILSGSQCAMCQMHCGDPRAQPDPIGGSEPKPRGHPTEAINQIRLSNPFIKYISFSILCGSDFNLGQAHKHLYLTKYIYNEGILCLFKMIYKIDIQSSKCFYKISKFKKKHDMNAQVGAYSEIPSL